MFSSGEAIRRLIDLGGRRRRARGVAKNNPGQAAIEAPPRGVVNGARADGPDHGAGT
jgi:hypothetical protein